MGGCHFCTKTLFYGDSFARRDTLSIGLFCTKIHFCTAIFLHERHSSTKGHFFKVILLQKGKLLQGDVFARRNFCTVSVIVRCYLCMATFLQSVTFAPGYIFTEIFIHCEIYRQPNNFEQNFTFSCFF